MSTVIVVKKNGIEVVYTGTVVVVKYGDTMVVAKPRDSEALKVLPEEVLKIVKAAVESAEPVK